MSDSDDEKKQAVTLAASSKTLATTFTWSGVSVGQSHGRSEETHINGPSGISCSFSALVDLVLWEERLHVFVLHLQITGVFAMTIVVPVRVERLEDVICDAADDRVDLEPVIQGLVLAFVEMPDALVFDRLELVFCLPELLQLVGLDRIYELVLELIPPLVFQGVVRTVLEAEYCRFWPERISMVPVGTGARAGAHAGVRAGFAGRKGIQTMSPNHFDLDPGLSS